MSEKWTLQPEVIGKSQAGFLVAADKRIVKLNEGSHGGFDCFTLSDLGFPQRVLQDAKVPDELGWMVSLQVSCIGEQSLLIGLPGDVILFAYFVDGGNDNEGNPIGPVPYQPAVSFTVPLLGVALPVNPTAHPKTGVVELDACVAALEAGGNITSEPAGGGKVIRSSDGASIVVPRMDFDKAQSQAANIVGVDNPSVKFFLAAVNKASATQNATDIGAQGAASGTPSEG